MSEPFLAEVRMVGFNFAPRGWALCDGEILPINQNQSLFALLGTIYGGDGTVTFALPDLRGRAPMHVGRSAVGTDHREGQRGGEETHTLSTAEMPDHTHLLNATNDSANNPSPSGTLPAQTPAGADAVYGSDSDPLDATLHPACVADVGGGQAHDNMQPFLAVNFCIALQGLFPSRN